MLDVNGNFISKFDMEKRCNDTKAFSGYIVIKDNSPNVIKRYRIENFCSSILKIDKDFGYKNPYQ